MKHTAQNLAMIAMLCVILFMAWRLSVDEITYRAYLEQVQAN
jgi:hypothetical protein